MRAVHRKTYKVRSMTKPKSPQFSPEVRERAVRMVQEH